MVYRDYDALSVLDALAAALEDHRPARTLLERRRPAVQRDPGALEAVLIDVLAGPCQQAANRGRPVLLLIDDLEQILERETTDGRRRVCETERPVLRAVLRAFDPARSESRLLVTSRFPFSLLEGEIELAGKLHALQLPPFNENAQCKLSRRQVEAARMRDEPGAALDEAGLSLRLPLLARVQVIACGNPGLQDLIGDRLVLRPAVPLARAEAVLKEMEAYLAGGALPSDEAVREFLQNIALDELLEQAGSAGRALLRAALLFEVPVPEPAIAALAAELGGTPEALRALGLFDAFEDIVDHRVSALAVNGLAAGRLKPLTTAEAAELAALCLSVLFAAWGGVKPEAAARRPYAADIILTQLGLLAGNAEVVAVCAADAVRGLQRNHNPAAAGKMGQAAIDLLEGTGREPSLGLLANTADALGLAGDGKAAAAVLGKGESRLDNAAKSNFMPAELSQFLFARGDRQVTAGDLDAALATFERLCTMTAPNNEQQLAVTQGRIADILAARGDLDEALRIRREEALPVFTRLGAVREIAITQGQIADILVARGDLEGALELQLARLEVNRKLRNVDGTAATLWEIAQIELAQKNTGGALAHLVEVWPLLLQLERADGIAVVGEMLGQMLLAVDLKEEALPVLRSSAEGYRKLERVTDAQKLDEIILRRFV